MPTATPMSNGNLMIDSTPLARVYILHPYRGQDRPGERKANLHQIEAIALFIARTGMIPISPIHCMGFLNDERPEQRELGLSLCRPWIAMADMVWAYVCGPDKNMANARLSDGCRRDLNIAAELGKRIIPLEYVDPLRICETRPTSV
jgi:hypothetical protein